MGKDVKAVDRQQLAGHRVSPDKRLLQDRCKWAGGGMCVPEWTLTSGQSGTQATVL